MRDRKYMYRNIAEILYWLIAEKYIHVARIRGLCYDVILNHERKHFIVLIYIFL